MYSVCACFSPSSFHIDFSDPIQPDINLDEDEDRDEEKKKFLRFHCCIASVFPFRFRLATRLLIVFIYLLMLFFMTHKKKQPLFCSSIGCELRAESVNNMSAFTLNPALALNEIFSYISSFIPTVAYAFNSAKKISSSRKSSIHNKML